MSLRTQTNSQIHMPSHIENAEDFMPWLIYRPNDEYRTYMIYSTGNVTSVFEIYEESGLTVLSDVVNGAYFKFKYPKSGRVAWEDWGHAYLRDSKQRVFKLTLKPELSIVQVNVTDESKCAIF